MNVSEETIDATLDASGQLQLSHPPRLPPGPVKLTIRSSATQGKRGLSDVIRDLAAEQRSRNVAGRPAADVLADDEARLEEDAERDRELDSARRATTPGGP